MEIDYLSCATHFDFEGERLSVSEGLNRARHLQGVVRKLSRAVCVASGLVCRECFRVGCGRLHVGQVWDADGCLHVVVRYDMRTSEHVLVRVGSSDSVRVVGPGAGWTHVGWASNFS